MLTHLLDTSVYSQRLRPKPVAGVIRRWQQLGDAALAISAICEAEILYGLERKGSARLWTEYHEYLENRLVLLPLDQAVAARYALLKARQQTCGQPVADFDLLIAATAMEHGLIVATLNVRHFSAIEELKVEDWTG
jgi:predicted nucleic acid-binding protein